MKFKRLLALILIMSTVCYLALAFCPKTIVTTNAQEPQGTLTSNIDGIDENLYPGYKTLINDLKAKHPNYNFLVYYTGLSWTEVLVTEFQGHGNSPINLVQKAQNYDGMWLCPICGTKNYDNGSWCCASLEALSYMMDPRNSINETDIFQFKDLEGADVSRESIAKVVAQYGPFLNNEEAINAIYDASNQYRINPFFLVAKIINEQGSNGSTMCNGNGYNGKYVGIYNYFNINAYGNSVSTIINNGLSYAQSHGWNSIRNSIMGGAEIVRDSYMTKYSQNTFYYQKFNVSGKSALASHQYQQNIMAAQSQGSSYRKYYDQIGALEGNYTFIIPLYMYMPAQPYARPDISKANTATFENGVVAVSSTLKVRASSNGTTIGKLNNGESVKVLHRASQKVGDYFWDIVVSNVNGTYGFVARDYIKTDGTNGTTTGSAIATQPAQTPTPAPEQQPQTTPTVEPTTPTVNDISITTDEKYIKTIPTMSVEVLKQKYQDAVVKDKDGKDITTGQIGTGSKVTIGEKTYTIVKKGDIDGDGTVTILDAVKILNQIKGTVTLENEYLQAACVKNQDKCDITDVVVVLNQIKGTANISL